MAKLTAVAALLALFATGCGNDTVAVSTAPKATEAPTESTAPDTAPETTTTAASAPDVSAADLLLGAIESSAGRAVRGQMRVEGDMVDADGDALSIDFESDAQGDIEAMLSGGGDPSAPPVTVRIVDGQTYAGFPGVMAAQFFPDFQGETAWFTVTGQDAQAFAIACVSPLAQLSSQPTGCDPAGDLRGIVDVADEVTVVGDEEVRGVPTQRLRFVVSMANLPSAGAAQDALGGELGGVLEGTIAVDVWIDDDMLLRMLAVDLGSIFAGFAEAFGGDDADMELPTWQTIIEYYDFDESISIEPPSPESLVGDFAQVQGFAG